MKTQYYLASNLGCSMVYKRMTVSKYIFWGEHTWCMFFPSYGVFYQSKGPYKNDFADYKTISPIADDYATLLTSY